MKHFAIIFLAIFIFHHSVNAAAVTEAPDDDDDWEDTSSGPTASGDPREVDDDGRVYKNPRNSPSAVCPRDEEQATLLGQKCLRKCSSDEDCKSKKKKCLCDGACGMSCIKPDRECPELEKPDLGDVTVSGRLFGDKAIYSCPHGYHVVGLQNRNCQADGQWAGQAPACKQNIYCLTPPHIEHARHSALPEQATFDLDATIQYHCHTGYVTNGFPRAKCLAIEGQASWYGPDITCEPRSCGPPGELPHGWVTAECHTFGCRAALHCGAGFELVGRAERFCQSDGTWAPNELPTCVLVTAVQCPTPDAPRHGRAIYTSCAYNSIVSYECKYGYRLVGDNTRRCGADKKWSGTQPMCKEINCGHPGRLYNGWLENIEAGTGLGASIIFRCHDGMRMEGNSSTVCQLDGSWRYPLPRCLAPCVVPHVTQGKVILVPSNITQETNETTPSSAPTTQIIGSSTMVHHGDALIVECEKNYEFPSSSPAVTCNNGTWTQILKCQPARCKRLPKPPKNGMVIAPKTDHGMRARFHCKDGFTLKGPEMLLCSFGNWTGEMPICQEVYCPFPGYIENGKVLLVGNMGLYDYRPYVKKVVNNKQIMYDCDKGYVLSEGPPGATCIGGNWSPKELPSCTPGLHPRLRWSRRRRSIEMAKRRYMRAQHLRKYYHQLQKRSIDIINYQNLLKSFDDYDNSIRFIQKRNFQNNLNNARKYKFDDLRNVIGSHFRRKRQIDNYIYNEPSQYNKLFRKIQKRSVDFYQPYYFSSKKYQWHNFFGLRPRSKRDATNILVNNEVHDSLMHHVKKRNIDVLPLNTENFIDVLPLKVSMHSRNKRFIDVLPFTIEKKSYQSVDHNDHVVNKRSIDILPLSAHESQFISHKIGKRQSNMFPIDILPFHIPQMQYVNRRINKRNIDILPLNNDRVNKRSIDILPFYSSQIEFTDHEIDKRQIDILPLNGDGNDYSVAKRSIDILPLEKSESNFVSHKICKRHLDILPFNMENDDHVVRKRSIIDILPLQDREKELITHGIGKRHIDILPRNDEENYHSLKKRFIDILPLNKENNDHVISKRSIDILPLEEQQKEFISHRIGKRHIDILPLNDENTDHILSKRFIDILPLDGPGSELMSHKIGRRHIDILPLNEEDNGHVMNKRSIIDILPLVGSLNEFSNHKIAKRHIDILPLYNEKSDHSANKRSIDILPLKDEGNKHLVDKRSIDILPFRDKDSKFFSFDERFENSHVVKKRFSDSPLANDEHSEEEFLDENANEVFQLPENEQISNERDSDDYFIGLLPISRKTIHFNKTIDDAKLEDKKVVDVLPLNYSRGYDLFRDFSFKFRKRRFIDVLPFEAKTFFNQKLQKRAANKQQQFSNEKQTNTSEDTSSLNYEDDLDFHSTITKQGNYYSYENLSKYDTPQKHSNKKRFIDILPLKKYEKKVVKRDVIGMQNSFIAKKYEEIKKQWEEEMMLKKIEEKTKIPQNGNFQENPPLKVDPKDVSKRSQNRGVFIDLPKVSAEEMIKRMKRTSRKTERLNQTTGVPKSQKDNKNRQAAPSPAPPNSATATTSSTDVGLTSGSNGEERAKGKGRVKGPCDPISSEPFVNIEVVKYGRDPNNTFSSGTIVRVACGKGYGLNLGYNSTAKCVRGRWKPTKPVCEILPCHIPMTEYGIFTLSPTEGTPVDTDTPLNETMDIENGQVVQFACETGYNVQGASNLRCWHGDWAVTSMPECVPAPCELPVVAHGVYSAGYRSGLTTAHGSAVTLHCERGYSPPAVLQCSLGEIRVRPPEPCQSIEGNISSIREGQDFRGGSDIVSEDFDELEYPTSSSATDCGPPARVQGTLIYRDGAPAGPSVSPQRYPHGTEVTFRCIAAIMGEKSTWKIFCDHGKWIGKSVSCEEEDMIPAGLLNNATCTFRNNEPNVVSFYNDLEIKEEVVEFPAGAILISRCLDIGKYAMIGPNLRKCLGGEWDGTKPSCFGLNQENDYAMEKPPTILFRHELGPIMQSNDGKLIVYPGTILHMECLWMRKFGNPKWNVSHEYRKYPEGWSSDPGRDSYLEYRLSVFHAVQDDSGVFTCITPARQSHQVEIVVEAVHCPPLPIRRGLISSSQSTKMGSEVSFSCANGNSLIGAAKITCLPSGNWSAPLPLCESVECGEVVTVASGSPNSRPRVSIVSRGVGGRAAFSCPSGWGLKGPTEIVCSPSGDWTPAPPVCIEVSCPTPSAPVNGYLLGKAPFRAGDVVQFNCNPAHMMQGQPIVACQDNARWSGETPKCIQACSYPGTTISGRMSSVKFYYKIGETISFTCEPGLILRGAPMLRCLRNGKWSNAIPICSKESSGNETYITGNDSDQLMNDAPILSDYTTTIQTSVVESSAQPSQSSKIDTMTMSFTGVTINTTSATISTTSTTVKPMLPETVQNSERRRKLTKSKTYFKFNQEMFLPKSTLPSISESTDKITEANTKSIEILSTNSSEVEENSTQTSLDVLVDSIIFNVDNATDANKDLFKMEYSGNDTSDVIADELSTASESTISYLNSSEIFTTSGILLRNQTLNTSEDSYSTVDTNSSTVKPRKAKLRMKTVVKNCSEVEDIEVDSDNESDVNDVDNNLNNEKVFISDSVTDVPQLLANLKRAKSTKSSVSTVDSDSKESKFTSKVDDSSTVSSTQSAESRKAKNKVSLDLLSLFQEIDKLENKNTTLNNLGTSRKKDLSHIDDATSAEIEHIKKQLGIETNSKRKMKNR